jgi:hypothetical protein
MSRTTRLISVRGFLRFFVQCFLARGPLLIFLIIVPNGTPQKTELCRLGQYRDSSGKESIAEMFVRIADGHYIVSKTVTKVW